MYCAIFLLSICLGMVLGLPNASAPYHCTETHCDTLISRTVSSISTVIQYPHPSTTYHHTRPTQTGDCGDDCGGVCGDSVVQPLYEDCDLGPIGNGAHNSGCSKDCKKVPYCGDGNVDTANGETCDRGPLNGVKDSGCSANCTCVPVCGNGRIEEGEECDAGLSNGDYNSGCSEDCMLCGYCGDSKVDDAAGEQCDNGYLLNGSPGNPCSANCTYVTCQYECGNGIQEPGEQCDHGKQHNGKPGDSCSSKCTWVDCGCGNGITEYPEQCDDGKLNGTPGSHCSVNCTWIDDCGNPNPPKCGNNIVELGEQCDDGWRNGGNSSNCTTHCTFRKGEPPRCGDSHLDAGEDCDDGTSNGTPASDCDSWCHWKVIDTCPCQTCNPNPFFNKCTITTSCINTPSGKDYCACRAGYRADGLAPTDHLQFRLAFPGQEYRVFVAPGVECDTLCTTPYPGPNSCKEVPVKNTC